MSDDYRYPLSLVSLPVLPIPTAPATPQASDVPAAAESASAATQPTTAAAKEPATLMETKMIEGMVIKAVSEIYDPEIPVNIYELGLIYDIKVNPDRTVHITMTLTAPACPVAGSLPGDVERKVEAIPEVASADVELVWEPAWSRDRMSEAALLTLGML